MYLLAVKNPTTIGKKEERFAANEMLMRASEQTMAQKL